jgi:hypothetical protein
LISGGFHGVIATLLWFVVAPRPSEVLSGHALAEVTVIGEAPRASRLLVETATGGGAAGWPAESRLTVAAPAPARRARALRAAPAVVAVAAAPEIAEAIPLPAAPTEPPPLALAAGGDDPAPAADPAGATFGAIDGNGAGEVAGGSGQSGEGDGTGDGFGSGTGAKDARAALHARVLGNVTVDVHPRDGQAIISHDEATALRERDSFPRLNDKLWPAWRPYVVSLEVCVGIAGQVTDVALRSSASARLDSIVLAAAKTWRYHPRVVDGQPTPFCHGVVIKYERW